MAPTIALSERMNRVDLGDEIACTASECRKVCDLRQMVLSRQLRKHLLHLGVDVFWVAEPIPAFAGPYFARFARPIIDILEEVVVDGLVMLIVQIAVRQRLFGPRQEH